MAHLVTGYAGSPHIHSKDQRAFNRAMFGPGEYVTELGAKCGASITNNNTVRIADGDIIMQGAHIRVEQAENLTIDNGTTGRNRTDLIVMTYQKNNADGTESAHLEVIKGTASTSSSPAAPSYAKGNLESLTKVQMPLYKVNIRGVVLESVTPMFNMISTYATLAEEAKTKFENDCRTFLNSLNILDTVEDIGANTLPNQLAGALGLKQLVMMLGERLGEQVTYRVVGDALYIDTFVPEQQ